MLHLASDEQLGDKGENGQPLLLSRAQLHRHLAGMFCLKVDVWVMSLQRRQLLINPTVLTVFTAPLQGYQGWSLAFLFLNVSWLTKLFAWHCSPNMTVSVCSQSLPLAPLL